MHRRAASMRFQPVYREFLSAEYSRRATIPLHQHRDHELIRVVKGHYTCELNGTALSLRPGQAVLVKPGDLHSDSFPRPPVRYQALSFYAEELDSGQTIPVFLQDVDPRRQILPMKAAQLKLYFDRLHKEALQPDEFSVPLRQAILSDLFWSMIRSLPPEILSPGLIINRPESERFCETLRALFAQYKRCNTLDVDAIATGMHMSRRNLTRTCNTHIGLSPAKAFLHYRIQCAADLLRQTQMNCSEVAAYLGFTNQYHFSVCFKRVTGISPQSCKDGVDPHGPRLLSWLK